MKKIVCLLALILFFSIAFSETTNSFEGFPLSAEIQSVSFDSSSRQLDTVVVLQNTSENFYSDIFYKAYLYKGDSLAEEGFLFEPLEYILTFDGNVSSVAPNEAFVFEMNFVPPANIEPGTYFMQLYFTDMQGLPIGTDYTKNAFFMSGSGGFIPALSGIFRSTHGDDSFGAGWAIPANEFPSIIIPLNENKIFAEKINSGSKILVKEEIYSLAFENKLVKESSLSEVSKKIDSKVGDAFEYVLTPGEWTVPGPYEVRLSFYDLQGREITTPIIARWLVDGFYARIFSAESGTNYYLAGDKVDLSLFISAWTNPGQSVVSNFNEANLQQVIVDVNMSGEQNGVPKEFSFSKNIEVSSSILGTTDLSSVVVPFEFTVKSINVEIKDPLTGRTLDSKQVIIKETQQKIVSGKPLGVIPSSVLDGNLTEPVGDYSWILILLVIVILLVVVFVFMKKNKKGISKGFLFIGILLLLSPFYFASYQSSTASIDVSYTSPWVYCGDTARITASACMSCGTCMNGVTGNLNIAGSNFYLWDQGHNWDNLCWGPFSAYPRVGTNDQAVGQTYNFGLSVSFNTGCHCYGSSASTSVSIPCTPKNKPPVIDHLSISNVTDSARMTTIGTSSLQIKNHFGTALDPYEIVECKGKAHDPDASGFIKSGSEGYNFSVKYRDPHNALINLGTQAHGTTYQKADGNWAQQFEVTQRIPVMSDIYCHVVVTDNLGGQTNGDSI